jgi:membrane-associated phospholipid phosphatase
VVSPHIVGVVLTSAIALRYGDKPFEILLWLILILPLIVLPPLIYVLWLVHKGTLKDIYMPQREARFWPLTVLLIWLLVCLGLIHYWQVPVIVEIFVLATTVLVGVLGLITLFWKISFHGATITAAVTTTVMLAGYSAWPVILLVPLVGWARIRLKRHTPRQVIYGSLVGAVIAMVLSYSFLPT